MKKILQTGLAIGLDYEACNVCNVDFNWMFTSPSSFIWLDKVVVPRSIWDIIQEYDTPSTHTGQDVMSQETKRNRAIKLVYDILNSANLVEIIEKDAISNEESEMIHSQIVSDVQLLLDYHYLKAENDMHFISPNNDMFCYPSLWALYATDFLSIKYNTAVGLSYEYMDYLRNLLSLKRQIEVPVLSKSSRVISDVLEMVLPQVSIWQPYVCEDENRCIQCARHKDCSDGYLSQVEKNIFSVLKLREQDEVQEFCQILDKISHEKFKEAALINPEDFIREINVECIKTQRKIKKVNKNVERWTNVLATISTSLGASAILYPDISPYALGSTLVTFISEYICRRNNAKRKQASWVELWNGHIENVKC